MYEQIELFVLLYHNHICILALCPVRYIQKNQNSLKIKNIKAIDNIKGTVKSIDNIKGTVKSIDNIKGTVKSINNIKGTVKSIDNIKGSVKA